VTTTLSRPVQVDSLDEGTLTGTGRLIRLAIRRDRVVLPVWMAVIVGVLVASQAALSGLYATEADRLAYATVTASNAIARAFDGPMAGTSLGAITMTESYGFLAVLVGIMSVQAVTRHTRQEEETGRAELLGSAVVGRHAQLTAALVVVVGVNLLIGAAVTVAFAASGLPLAGSLAAGTAVFGVGLCFAAVAAVAVQVLATQRGANGLGVATIGGFFLLRAVGDALGAVSASGVEVVSAWPSWLSPIGWGQQVRAFGDERWAVLLLFPLLAGGLLVVAFTLRSKRDVGRGLVPVRPGPAAAAPSLLSPLGLAWRLHRGALLAWAVGIGLMSLAIGAVADEAEELISTSDELATLLADLGEGALTDLFFGFYFGLLSVAAAGYTVQVVLRARNEEVSGRAEPLLATAVSRPRWLSGHLVLAALGTAALLVVGGLAASFAHAVDTGQADHVRELLLAALVNLPAPLALGAFVVALIGLAPRRAAAAGWAALLVSLVMGQFGALLELPQQLLNLSPFTHPPAVPAEELTWTPVLTLLAVTAVLTAVGAASLRRRDLVTT
jgi:ABC-2 type transport system permease protein